ncbi:uncharacterized protein LOC124335746 isoform X3 [Daphnia pulicaria]|uniref:uncharacterized protein LOC124335746 isoform X3 n=1 Tax=Daphnia pulicaria TaxID=35523 RepID=UPI001EEBA54E|nr:uncharacterized protein LOC124335746 isoform X3 [Daphnia pulicaria]
MKKLTELMMSLCENSALQTDFGIQMHRLVKKGADVNRKTIGGRTPLMIVCWKNRRENVVEVVNILLSYGADVKKTDDFGWNALQFACRYNCTPQLPSIIDVLLKHGIDVNAKTTNKWNCLHQLCKYNSGEKLYQVIASLIRHTINVNAQTSKKDTALHLLTRYCRRDFSAIFQLLINAGARVDLVSSNDKTLLHVLCKYAVGLDLIGVMNNLINSCQTMVDCFDYYKATAIVYAARLGCAKTVSFLLPYSHHNVIDIFGQNVIDHLNDVLSNSFPLCICCRRMDSFLPPELLEKLSTKKPFHAKLSGIDRDALERAIPRRIDYGFTNTNRETIIQLPSGNAWNIIKDVWTTDSDLDTTKILQFLSKHAHQMDDKLGKVGCSQNHCHWCAATNAVCEYVNQLVITVAHLDNRFQGEIIQYGSSAENSKIIAPDEFDFMVVLANFKEDERKYYDGKYVVLYDGDESSSIFENEQDGSTSSAKLLYYFYLLLADAVNRINHLNVLFHNISFSETCVTLDCFYRGKEVIHPGQYVFKLSIDITVGVIGSQTNTVPLPLPSSFRLVNSSNKDDKYFLVPHRQVAGSEISGWKPSFPTVERNAFHAFDPVVTRCYCLLKLFVLLVSHIDECFGKTKPSSYAIKTCLFNYVKKNPPPWEKRCIVKHCIGICTEFLDTKEKINSFFEKSLTVYVIKYESRYVMNKIRDRLKSAQESSCISSNICSCKGLNISNCILC